MQQTARRRAKEEQGESESFHAIVLSALERVHGIQTQPFVCNQRRGKCVGRHNRPSGFGPHAGRSRCAAVFIRRSGHVRDFAATARKSLTRATSTKSKRPARTTKFSSCRSVAARQRKFPPVPAATRRRSIRRTENISPGARKRARASKPINGGSSCKIDNPGNAERDREL